MKLTLRVVKPRTAAQRAAQLLRREKSGLVIIGSTAGLPTSSWWTTPRSREEFAQAVAANAPRMATSAMGRAAGRPINGDLR